MISFTKWQSQKIIRTLTLIVASKWLQKLILLNTSAIIYYIASFNHTSELFYLRTLLHVIRVHFATLSSSFVADREIVLVWSVILVNVLDFFTTNYITLLTNKHNLISSVQHNCMFLQKR
jgi:hypothetical protein